MSAPQEYMTPAAGIASEAGRQHLGPIAKWGNGSSVKTIQTYVYVTSRELSGKRAPG